MMRLRERELTEAHLVRRISEPGPLGSRPEAFSRERTPFRASVLPESGRMQAETCGLSSGKRLRLLTDMGLDAKAGDGVWLDGAFYVILSVGRWTAHQELECEARV